MGAGSPRLRCVNPMNIEIQEDCKVRFGFPDRHLELSMKYLGVSMTLSFTFDEIKLGLRRPERGFRLGGASLRMSGVCKGWRRF